MDGRDKGVVSRVGFGVGKTVGPAGVERNGLADGKRVGVSPTGFSSGSTEGELDGDSEYGIEFAETDGATVTASAATGV